MASATFSGNSGYRLDAVARRSGTTVYVDVTVVRTGRYLAWSTAAQNWHVQIDGVTQNDTWTYDFRNSTSKVLGTKSRSGLSIGSKSWSVTVFMASGIGSATVSGTIDIPPSAPAAPTLGTVTRTSDTSHTVNWTRNASSTAPYYSQGVQRQDFENGDWGTWKNVVVLDTDYTNSGSHSYTDTTTKANGVYRYRVFSYNRSGTGISSQTEPIYTTPAAPSVTLEAVSSTQVKATVIQSVTHTNYETELQYRSAGGAWTTLTTLGSGVFTHTWTPPAGATIQVRARTVINRPGFVGDNLASAYASSNIVPLQQPPLAPSNLYPNGSTLDRAKASTFTWKHNSQDTSAQTAYEFERLVDGVWQTSGKITSSASSRNYAANFFVAGAYQWRVRTWGVHADPGPWSSLASFTAEDAPVVTVTSPAGEVETSRVTVTWTSTKAQSQWEAELLRGSERVAFQTGSGTTASYQFPNLLEDGQAYSVKVRSKSSAGLWSAWATASFNADFPSPAAPGVSLGWDTERGAVLVTVDNPPTPVNLVTNPSFETGTHGWTALGTGWKNGGVNRASRSDTPNQHGSYMGTLVADGTTSRITIMTSATTPLAPGKWVGVSCWAGTFGDGARVMLELSLVGTTTEYRNAGIVASPMTAGGFHQVVHQADADTTGWRVGVAMFGPADGSNLGDNYSLWVDQVMVIIGDSQAEVEAALATGYADGDTPGWKWDGTPHASTSRMADAISNEVYRSYDGENWELVATDVPLGSTIADSEVALNTEVFYRVNAVSALGTVGTADSVSTFTESKVGYWAAGDNFYLSQQIRMNLGDPPGIDFETGLAQKELHYFAGRTLPVEFSGAARLRTGEASFMVGSVLERDQVIEMSYLPAPHLFRLPDGTFLYASVEPASTHRVDEGFYTVEIPLTEVSK